MQPTRAAKSTATSNSISTSAISLWSLAATASSSRRNDASKRGQSESQKRSFRNVFVRRKSSNIEEASEQSSTDAHGENNEKSKQRRVRFDMAQDCVHEVSYQHDAQCQQHGEAAHVSKSDLWWSSNDKHQNRARDQRLVYTDENAMQYLAKASTLQEQTVAKIKVASRYLGIHDVEVGITQDLRDQVVVAAAASCSGREATTTRGDSGCYRGLEVFVGDRHEQEHRQREIRAVLQQQEILQSECAFLCNTIAEELRIFSEEQSLKWRAVARQWGLVDAAASAAIAVES